jgi:hypothetical protein
LPTSLLFQCDRSGNRQLVTIQGDQDFGLDLTQAVGGQLLFNKSARGFGVVFENGDPLSNPRWAAASYNAVTDKMTLTLSTSLIGGKRKVVKLSGVASSGKYDGVYTAVIVAGNCASISAKLTIKGGIVSGTNSSTGTIAGTMDDFGNLSFTTQMLVVPAGCSQGGSHAGTFTFVGQPALNPFFPTVVSGVFSGTGASGSFTLQQPTGLTGATTPGGVPRSEVWTGTLTGKHESTLCAGGVFGESYSVSLNFPSSLVAALRGKTSIISGSGTFSGSETVQTQAPFPTGICSIIASTVSGSSVNITFAGALNGHQGGSIQFSSPSVLIPSKVHFFTGPDAGMDKFENRQIIKLSVSSMTATGVTGAWSDGDFVLRKQ